MSEAQAALLFQLLMMATCALAMECGETSPQDIVRVAPLTGHVGRRG